MEVNKERCTASAEGVIIGLFDKGLDNPTVMKVRYRVNSDSYDICESIKYKIKTIKLGFIPIGQKKVPALPYTEVGNVVCVMYNPDNIHEAYIKGNEGHVNC